MKVSVGVTIKMGIGTPLVRTFRTNAGEDRFTTRIRRMEKTGDHD